LAVILISAILFRKQEPLGGFFVSDGKVNYSGVNQEVKDKYVYTLSDWPFVLFEVLYSALGEEFDRTSIKLKFFIKVINTDESTIEYYSSVAHEDVTALCYISMASLKTEM
jgi:hypothetical protein